MDCLAGRTLTPISTRTNTASPPISVGGAGGLAVVPNGKTVYVVSSGGVTPIRTATNTAGTLIPAGGSSITVTPNGKTAYVLDGGNTYQDAYVTPIRTATNRPGKPIPIPVDHAGSPWAVAGQALIISTPDSKTVYATSPTSNKVTPISTPPTGPASRSPSGCSPTPWRPPRTAGPWSSSIRTGTASLISIAANRVTATIRVGTPWTVWLTIRPLAITPDGRTAYVINYKANAVTPISLPAGKAGKPIIVGNRPVAVVTSPAPPSAPVTGNGPAASPVLQLLRDVLEWSLTPMLREDVVDVLDGLAEEVNLANPDQLDALSEATIALELAAPARIIKIDKDAVPAPDRIRERVNHLIHELTLPGKPDALYDSGTDS